MSEVLNYSQKKSTREALSAMVPKWKSQKKVIGFTSGCFDIVHLGHCSYLEQAKNHCNILIIGVNSDQSVRAYKGNKRPIIPEQERLALIAALASTDYCFLFDEINNRTNIKTLQPHLYIKAGDYDSKNMTSAKYIEAWGGKPLILPFIEGNGTSAIIDEILQRYMDEKPSYIPLPSAEVSPAVFLDKDGVINREVEYLHKSEQFELIPGAIEALQQLQKKGFKLIIITTQAGIGLGYFSKEDFYKVNKTMLTSFHQHGITLDRIFFCPHSKRDGCSCRKPNTELVDRGINELNIDRAKSFFIGDKTSDILTGKNSGLTSILVATGHGGRDKEFDVKPEYYAKDLLDASTWIINKKL